VTPQEIEERARQFESVNVHDDEELLTWLKGLFEACAQARIELPRRDQIATRIGMARMLLPNPALPPIMPVDRSERTTWLLTLCINTLITSDTPQKQAGLYGIVAYAIDAWLKEQRAS
jgi:hypothetical protein